MSTWLAYSSISIDLPDPWVCQTTPARPSLRTASMVLPTASDTAKYWCGLAIRLTRPSSVAGERDVAGQQLEEPVVLEHAVQQQHDRLVLMLGPAAA